MLHIPDVLAEPHLPRFMRELAKQIGTYAIMIAPLIWEGHNIGSIHVTRQPPGPFDLKEIKLLEDLRRPGRDRDPERAHVRRDQGSAGRRRGRQRGQERLPGDHEPRDPHPHECRHRHERAAARHRARRRAAGLRLDHPRLGRCAADHHQRHPRLLEDRGRPDGHRGRTRSTCASAWSRRSTWSAPGRPRRTSTRPMSSKARCPPR